MRIQKIKNIRKRFHNEWLLIEVLKTDERTTTGITGRLIAHSPLQDAIYKKLLQVKSKNPIMVDYSTDTLPKGMAVAFIIYA